MLTLDRPQDAERIADDAARYARLRVQPAGPVVELAVGKLSVGSSPRCDLRLQQPGIQPVHCLILRTNDGLSVRRWAGKILLNGAELDHSPLLPGDCLQVGTVELDVLGTSVDELASATNDADAQVPCDAYEPWCEKQLNAAGENCEIVPCQHENTCSPIPEPQPVLETDSSDARASGFGDESAPPASYPNLHETDLFGEPLGLLAEQVDRLIAEQNALEGPCALLALPAPDIARERDEARELCEQLQDELRAAASREIELVEQVEQLQRRLCDRTPEDDRPLERTTAELELESRCEQLQASLDAITLNQENLVAERETWRQEAGRTAELEQQVRQHLADREATAAELYRALIQLAELQDNKEHEAALQAAQEVVQQQLDASMQEVAALQSQVDELRKNCDDCESARNELSAQVADIETAHRELLEERDRLSTQLAQQCDELQQLQQRLELDSENNRQADAKLAESESVLNEYQRLLSDAQSTICQLEAQLEQATINAELERARQVEQAEQTAAQACVLSPADASGPLEQSIDDLPVARDSVLHQLMKEPSLEAHGDGAVAPVETAQAAPQTSYIERYSHMFAEDDAAAAPTSCNSSAVPQAEEERMPRKSRTLGSARSAGDSETFVGDDDEESIEDYMAKLLQRVRGESNPAAVEIATVQTPTAHAAPASQNCPLEAPRSKPASQPGEGAPFEFTKRRSSLPAPQTDLEALRALANESARRAISRHASKKHRRNAVTKTIVSLLAGFTGVWLMLQSTQLLSVQFLSACALLLVAAYWVGETIRSLLETTRAASPDDTDAEIEELAAQLSEQADS